MSMIRLELSNRDYNTIAEALLESALDCPKTAKNTGIWIDFCHKSGISGNLRWKKLHNSLFYRNRYL